MTGTTTIKLDSLPSLGPLYARAALLPKSRPSKVESLPQLRVEVAGVRTDPDLLARYRQVCGFTDAATMPITWPQTLAAALQIVVLVHPEFPLPAMGVVHLSQSIDLLEELDSDAVLDLSCAVGAWERTARGLEFELLTEARKGGKLAWRGTTRILGRLKVREERSRPAALSAEPAAIDPTPPARSVCWWVPEDLGRKYGAVSGDYNPIHLWAATAKPFGFKRAIAQGMWLLARCAAELEDDVGAGARTLSVEFRRPVSLPSKVAFDARLRGPRALDFALLSRDPGKPHLAGSYTAR